MAKMDKSELKGPDTFVSMSDKFFSWVERHARSVAAILLLVAVASLGYIGYTHWESIGERKAADALYQPEAELRKVETKAREAKAAKMEQLAVGQKKDAPDSTPSVDYAKDYAPIVSQITGQIKAHANTKAALVSALNLANFLVQQKQFEQALAVLEIPTYKPSANDLLGGFHQMHRGLALIENQKADEALKAYEAVLAAESLKFFHPEALLKSGVALELKGDTEKARQRYEKLSREFPDTEAAKSAQQYIRLLELKTQQG